MRQAWLRQTNEHPTKMRAPSALKKFDWVLLCFEAKYLFAGN